MQFNSYSLNAPRMGKKKFTKNLISDELFNKFKNIYPKYKDVSNKELLKIWRIITERFRYYAVYNPLGVKLPKNMGEIKLQYLPYKMDKIDYVKSQELGEVIKRIDIPLRGRTPVVKWERRQAVHFNKILQFYSFKEARKIPALAKTIVDEIPQQIRTARVTLGGKSVWRKKL